MAYEIKEIIIKALVGDHNGDKNEMTTDDDSDNDYKEVHEKQDTIDAVTEMLKNEKER